MSLEGIAGCDHQEDDMRSEELDQIGNIVYLEKKRAFTGNTAPVFWAVASGKGGVGRSFFTSSAAITLSRWGYRVLVVDCDDKGGTLHSWMGTLEKTKNISDFYQNSDGIENYIVPVGQEKLCMLAGDTCMWNNKEFQVRRASDLLAQLKKQPFDVVIFDLAAGCDSQTMEILRQADETFVLTTPEAASIERTYRWIETYIANVCLTESTRRELFDFNKDRRKNKQNLESLFATRDFFEGVQTRTHGESKMFGPLKLVVNQARNFEDERLGESIKSICNKYYYLDMMPLGALNYDNAVWQSARQRVPVLIHQPFNQLVGQIQGLMKHLVDQSSQRAVV